MNSILMMTEFNTNLIFFLHSSIIIIEEKEQKINLSVTYAPLFKLLFPFYLRRLSEHDTNVI